jgi:hypothetical protein
MTEGANETHCMDLCLSDGSCLGVTWNSKTGQCKMHFSTDAFNSTTTLGSCETDNACFECRAVPEIIAIPSKTSSTPFPDDFSSSSTSSSTSSSPEPVPQRKCTYVVPSGCCQNSSGMSGVYDGLSVGSDDECHQACDALDAEWNGQCAGYEYTKSVVSLNCKLMHSQTSFDHTVSGGTCGECAVCVPTDNVADKAGTSGSSGGGDEASTSVIIGVAVAAVVLVAVFATWKTSKYVKGLTPSPAPTTPSSMGSVPSPHPSAADAWDMGEGGGVTVA